MYRQLIFLALTLTVLACTSHAKDVILKISADEKKHFSKELEACFKETGASEEEFARFEGKDLDSKPKNENCFFECYHKKVGTMDKNGIYNKMEILKPYFTPVNYESALKCVKSVDSIDNACTKAFRAELCYSGVAI